MNRAGPNSLYLTVIKATRRSLSFWPQRRGGQTMLCTARREDGDLGAVRFDHSTAYPHL